MTLHRISPTRIGNKGRKTALETLAKRRFHRDTGNPTHEDRSVRKLERVGNEEALAALEAKIAEELAQLEAAQAEKERNRLEDMAKFAARNAERIAAVRKDEARIAAIRRSARYQKMLEQNIGTEINTGEFRRQLQVHDQRLSERGLDPNLIGEHEAKPIMCECCGKPIPWTAILGHRS